MRTTNDTLITGPTVVAGSYESEALYVGRSLYYSFQLSFNSANAAVKLQCSSDFGDQTSLSPQNYRVVNWTDIDSSEEPITGSGTGVFDVSEIGYTWVRLVITGDVNLESVRFNGKGG